MEVRGEKTESVDLRGNMSACSYISAFQAAHPNELTPKLPTQGQTHHTSTCLSQDLNVVRGETVCQHTSSKLVDNNERIF